MAHQLAGAGDDLPGGQSRCKHVEAAGEVVVVGEGRSGLEV